MKKLLFAAAVAASFLSVSSCVGITKPEAAEKREQWVESLNDSIARYKAQADSASEQLNLLRSRIGEMIPDFDHISNAREVEGYYIYKGWSARYPLTSTDLVARISENEGLELIAALSGGVFDRISVSSGGNSVSSAVVPHDQALNYRAGNINTVCFTGAQADSVAAFIADALGAVSVSFIGGAKNASLSLSSSSKEMIAATWRLYAAQKESHSLEKLLPLLSRKVDLCRRMLHENDSTK